MNHNTLFSIAKKLVSTHMKFILYSACLHRLSIAKADVALSKFTDISVQSTASIFMVEEQDG
jgi:hypothetical protein